MKRTLILIITSVLFIASCSRSGGRPQMTNQKMPTQEVKVTTQTISRGNLVEFVELSGKLEGISDIDVVSEVSGKFIEVYKKLGNFVKKGETIAKIDNKDIELQLEQAKATTLAAKANLDSEDIKMKINQKLYNNESISEVEYIMSQSAYKTAKANYEGALANQKSIERTLENSHFIAPISGKIAALPIQIGDYVSMGSHIYSIVDDSKMVIRTGVGPSSIRLISIGDPVCITTKFGDQTCNGTVVGKGFKVGQDNFNYPIEIELTNSLELLSGQLVTGKIEAQTFEDVIFINPSSIKEYYDKKVVYVVNSENVVEKRFIEIGREVSDKIIVTSGLKVGDEMIIEGFEMISEGSKVTSKNITDKQVPSEDKLAVIGG